MPFPIRRCSRTQCPAKTQRRTRGITSSACYFQDDWVQNEHLTWFLGARWDYERNMGYLDYVTPANVAAALNGPDPNAPRTDLRAEPCKGGVNVNDFISTGHNRSPDKGEFSRDWGSRWI